MTTEVLKRLFTVKQYHRMIETGIIQEGDRVELLRGEILEMAAIGTRHAAGVRRVSEVLRSKLGSSVLVDTQNPVEVDEYSEPQPDIAILRPRADFYVSAHPTPEDVFLLIEVSDSTIRRDRPVKIPLYAEDNIAEAWIVDVNAELVEVYRQPSASGYRSQPLCGVKRSSLQPFQECQFQSMKFSVRLCSEFASVLLALSVDRYQS